MRRLVRRRGGDEGALFDLTPMIDVVFLLLIFFMVSTRVLEPYGYTVDLPESEAAPSTEGTTQTPILTVLADGRAVLASKIFALDDELPLELLAAKQTVMMRADKAATHGDVMRWMDRLHAAGVISVTLVTVPIENAPRP